MKTNFEFNRGIDVETELIGKGNRITRKLLFPVMIALVLLATVACTAGGRAATSSSPAPTTTANLVVSRPSGSAESGTGNSQGGGFPSVTTGTALDVTDTSATLRGTFDNMGSAQAVNVSFQWGTAPGSYSNETPPATMGTTAPFQATLNGLASGTTYYFRAKAVGSGTAYGGEMTFIAGQPGLSSSTPSVSTGNALNVTGTGGILVGGIDSMGNLTSFDVNFEWGTTPGSYSSQTTSTTMGTTGAFQVGLTGLSPGTTYYFRARGTNGTTTAYGTEARFTTK